MTYKMQLFTAGDLNDTYFVGNVDEASKQLVRVTYECLEKAIAIGDAPVFVLYSLVISFLCSFSFCGYYVLLEDI
jgi:hypothetical protein